MDSFFTKMRCDRCGQRLQGRFMSRDGTEALCHDCKAEDDPMMSVSPERGANRMDVQESTS